MNQFSLYEIQAPGSHLGHLQRSGDAAHSSRANSPNMLSNVQPNWTRQRSDRPGRSSRGGSAAQFAPGRVTAVGVDRKQEVSAMKRHSTISAHSLAGVARPLWRSVAAAKSYALRVKSMIQLVSQVLPPSAQNACCQRQVLAVISDQRNRVRIGLPSKISSA